MTVATFSQPDFNVDDPTTYRTKLDGNTAVATAIIDNFAPHAVSTPNMTVQLDAGAIPGVGAAPVQVALQTSATLTAPTSNPRHDIVYIDSATGVIGIATGTEAATPADPAVPAGKIAIARLSMTVGMSSITNSIITDLRAPAMAFGGGSAFTAISSSTTLTIGQSGGRFKLTGVGTAVTLPTPSGNANTSFLLWGGDANTQTITPAATNFKMPDGTTPTSYSVTANQGIEVVSDGSVYQVVRMVGKVIGQTPASGDNSTQVATTAFVQSALTHVAKRQATLAAPVDTSGLPIFLPTTSASLSITSQNVTSSAPLIVTTANGFTASGSSDRFGYTSANITWTGLTANVTNYLYVDVASDGTLTTGSTTLAPVYQQGGTPSTTSGQATFNIAQMQMFVGNGSTAPQAYRVFVGEAVAGASTITSTIAYSLMGRYQLDNSSAAANTTYTHSHNIGTDFCNIRILVANGTYGWTEPRHIYSSSDIGQLCGNLKRNSVQVRSLTDLYFVEPNTGTTVLATKYRIFVDRAF